MWKYIILNNPKITYSIIFENTITGVNLYIQYSQTKTMSEQGIKDLANEILTKLNYGITN